MERTLATTLCLVVVLATFGGHVAAATATDATQQTTDATQQATDATQQPTEIDSCTTIDEPGTYVLTADVENATGTCIHITASNVVLDGNGHTIDGVQNESTLDAYVEAAYAGGANATNATENETIENATTEPATEPANETAENATTETMEPANATTEPANETTPGDVVANVSDDAVADVANVGIEVNGTSTLSNVTVRNVSLTEFTYGAYVVDVEGVAIENVTATENGDAVDVVFATDVTVTESTFTENRWGVFTFALDDATFSGVNASENGETGLYLQNSTRVSVVDVTTNANDASGLIADTTNDSTFRSIDAERNAHGGVVLAVSSNDTVEDVNASENGLEGVGIHAGGTDNVVRDVVAANTTGESVLAERFGYSAGIVVTNATDNAFANVTAPGSAQWAFYAENESTNTTVDSLVVDAAGTTVSFQGVDVAIGDVESPPEPPADATSIGRFVNASSTGADAALFLNVSYEDADLQDVDESALALWRSSNGDWTRVDGGVNVDANYVYGNVTEFGVFAPLATNETTAGNETATAGTETTTKEPATTEEPATTTEGTATTTEANATTEEPETMTAGNETATAGNETATETATTTAGNESRLDYPNLPVM